MRRVVLSWQTLTIFRWAAVFTPVAVIGGGFGAGMFFRAQGNEPVGIILFAACAVLSVRLYRQQWFNELCERSSSHWVRLRNVGAIPTCVCGVEGWTAKRHIRNGCPFARATLERPARKRAY